MPTLTDHLAEDYHDRDAVREARAETTHDDGPHTWRFHAGRTAPTTASWP